MLLIKLNMIIVIEDKLLKINSCKVKYSRIEIGKMLVIYKFYLIKVIFGLLFFYLLIDWIVFNFCVYFVFKRFFCLFIWCLYVFVGKYVW